MTRARLLPREYSPSWQPANPIVGALAIDGQLGIQFTELGYFRYRARSTTAPNKRAWGMLALAVMLVLSALWLHRTKR